MSTATKTAVPELASVSPRYAEATGKLARVEARLVALDGRIAKVLDDLSDLVNNGDAAALALLAADDLDAAGAGGVAGLIAERDKLAGDRATTVRAIDMARLEVRQARSEASAVICGDLLPLYRSKVDRLARALLGAHEAHRDLEAITDELSVAEIGWAGRLHPMQIGYFRDAARDDLFPVWLREAREHGLTTVELPADWVRSWGLRPIEAPVVRVAVKRR